MTPEHRSDDPIDLHEGERGEVVELMRRIGAAPDAPDSDHLLEMLAEALPSTPKPLRWACAAVGAVVVAIALPWLVGYDPFDLLGDSSAVHLARDGALGVVIGSSGLVAAWRPRWSLPCAVSATVALFAQMVAGVADETIAETGGNELVHAPAIALAFLLAASAVRLGPLGPRRTRTSP